MAYVRHGLIYFLFTLGKILYVCIRNSFVLKLLVLCTVDGHFNRMGKHRIILQLVLQIAVVIILTQSGM